MSQLQIFANKSDVREEPWAYRMKYIGNIFEIYQKYIFNTEKCL